MEPQWASQGAAHAAPSSPYGEEDIYEDYVHGEALAMSGRPTPATYPPYLVASQNTTKVPPLFDGRTSWFAYEEAIDNWCDITELEESKRGPALRNRLVGDAAIYQQYLDRESLKDPVNGVAYLKRTLRPFFVKGAASVFLWRFMRLFRFNRGHHDILTWITRLGLLRKRLHEAWGDLFTPVGLNDAGFTAFLATPEVQTTFGTVPAVPAVDGAGPAVAPPPPVIDCCRIGRVQSPIVGIAYHGLPTE